MLLRIEQVVPAWTGDTPSAANERTATKARITFFTCHPLIPKRPLTDKQRHAILGPP